MNIMQVNGKCTNVINVTQNRYEKEKQKKLKELRDRGLISPSSDWTLDSDGEPARRSELFA